MGVFRKKGDSGEAFEREQYEFQKNQAIISSADNPEAEQVYLNQQKDKEDLLRWQQSIIDELEELKHKLRGNNFNPDKGVWEKDPNSMALMNEKGIAIVDYTCRPLLSRNLINSNLDERMIASMLKRTSDALVNNFAFYGVKEYDMEFANFTMVLRVIKNTIIPTPHRALKGWNKRQDNMMSKRVEAFSEQPNQANQKKGFWSMFS